VPSHPQGFTGDEGAALPAAEHRAGRAGVRLAPGLRLSVGGAGARMGEKGGVSASWHEVGRFVGQPEHSVVFLFLKRLKKDFV
jgi:hypothetical protein